jgi:integrase
VAKATKRLTKRTVDALKPGQLAWDSAVAGFGVRCQRRDKVFILKTRVRGRERWFSIGPHGSPWTVETARRKAKGILGDIADGADPASIRDNTKGAPTVTDLAERYLAQHVEFHNQPRTAKVFKQIVDACIVPALGRHRVVDVNRSDVVKLHHGMRRTPRHANHAVSVLSKMMHLAEAWGWRPDGSNPCRLVKRYAERQRDRLLTEVELQRLGTAISDLLKENKLLPGVAVAIHLAALTGCRMSEILTLQWTDVDLAAGSLTIREAKAGGRTHPIGIATVAVLKALRRPGPWVVWATEPANPISQSTLEHAWQRVRERAKLPDIRFHDLRHAFGTYAGQAGANAFLVRDVLGHKTLTMTGRYVNRDVDPLRRLANQVSSRIAAALTNKSVPRVVPLAARKR